MTAGEKNAGGTSDEIALIRRAKDGDHRAFEVLVKRYQKRIYRLVYRFCPDHDTADELAQETFVKAYTALGTFREEYRFISWLSTIASNLSINYIKRHRRQVSTQNYPIEEIVVDTNPTRDPGKKLADKEMGEAIERAVEKLPEEFKSVFILRVYEDLPYQEIADRLKIEIGTVMSRLFRARSRLKKELEEYL